MQITRAVVIADKLDRRRTVEIITTLGMTIKPSKHNQTPTFTVTYRIGLVVDKNNFLFIDNGQHLHRTDRHEYVLILTTRQHQPATIVECRRNTQTFSRDFIRPEECLRGDLHRIQKSFSGSVIVQSLVRIPPLLACVRDRRVIDLAMLLCQFGW